MMNDQEIKALKAKAAEEKVIIATAVADLCSRIERDLTGKPICPITKGQLQALVTYTQDHITHSINRLFVFPRGFVTIEKDLVDVNIELIEDFIDHKALSRGINLRRK